jgi:hypothetical protein
VEENIISRSKLKAEAIAEFHQLLHERSGGIIRKLLEILLDDLRHENDTVAPELLAHNQGKIALCIQLLDALQRDSSLPRK